MARSLRSDFFLLSHSEQALKDVDDLTKPIGEELAISPSTQSCACKSQRQSLALSESRIEPTTSPFKSTIARVEKRKGRCKYAHAPE